METDLKFFSVVVLLALSFVAALLLENKLTTGTIELVLIVIGVIVAAVAIYGLWIGTSWAWPVTTILFAASLANLLYLFLATRSFLLFAFALLVNAAGMVFSVLSVDNKYDWLETYNFDELPDIMPKRRKSQKRKRR